MTQWEKMPEGSGAWWMEQSEEMEAANVRTSSKSLDMLG